MRINLRIIDDVIGRSLEPSRNMLRGAGKAADEAAPTIGKLVGDDRRLPSIPLTSGRGPQVQLTDLDVSNGLLELARAKNGILTPAAQKLILPTPRW